VVICVLFEMGDHGSVPATALSSATSDKLFTHICLCHNLSNGIWYHEFIM